MEDKIITLITTNFSHAQLLTSLLDASNIKSYIINENLIQSSISHGVKIRVALSQLEDALAIVGDFEDNIKSSFTVVQSDRYINRILLPIDFSDFSEDLCDYTLDLAKKYNADILLFNAYFTANVEIINFTESFSYDSNVAVILDELRQDTENKITRLKNRLKEKIDFEQISGVDVDFIISPGNAVDQIKIIAEQYRPDLIIMGNKGESSDTSNVLGDVISSIIENVSVPLMILSETGIKSKLHSIENIMYATNFEKKDFKAIASLKLISTPYNLNISCVHFEKVNSKRNLILNKYRMSVLDKYINKLFDDNNVKTEVVLVDDETEDIGRYISNNNIGAIAILARKHSLLEKLLRIKMNRKLFVETHVPIIIFH